MTLRNILMGITLAATSQLVLAAPMTLDEAVGKATDAYPGEVTKAYQETKRGQELWEVKINAEDGQQWEVYYSVETGELIKAEAEND